MKKVFMFAALVAALASCQSKASKAEMAATDSLAIEEMSPMVEATEVYEGTLPAANGPGIDYVLTLDMLADSNDTLYTLDMTYLDGSNNGAGKKMTVKGKPQMIHKVTQDAKTKKPVTKKALKLNPSDGSAPLYFVVANDTTLTLVNDNLDETVSDMNYDIIRVK